MMKQLILVSVAMVCLSACAQGFDEEHLGSGQLPLNSAQLPDDDIFDPTTAGTCSFYSVKDIQVRDECNNGNTRWKFYRSQYDCRTGEFLGRTQNAYFVSSCSNADAPSNLFELIGSQIWTDNNVGEFDITNCVNTAAQDPLQCGAIDLTTVDCTVDSVGFCTDEILTPCRDARAKDLESYYNRAVRRSANSCGVDNHGSGTGVVANGNVGWWDIPNNSYAAYGTYASGAGAQGHNIVSGLAREPAQMSCVEHWLNGKYFTRMIAGVETESLYEMYAPFSVPLLALGFDPLFTEQLFEEHGVLAAYAERSAYSALECQRLHDECLSRHEQTCGTVHF